MTLCDSCGKEREVAKTRISVQGERGIIADLCEQCRKPVTRLRDSIAKTRPTHVSVSELPVASIEDIQSQVRAQARKGRKGSQTHRKAPRTREDTDQG